MVGAKPVYITGVIVLGPTLGGVLLTALSLFVATVTLLLALTLGQRSGFAQRTVFALFALSSTALTAFVIIELRTDPGP